jgi:hypothetical protein
MTDVQTTAFRLVDGRRVDGAPPSTMALSPPLRRARGRDEAFFLLAVNLGHKVPLHVHNEIRELATRTFWSTTGSVTAALRQSVVAVNRYLFGLNLRAQPKNRLYGGITCAAVQSEEVFLAQAGPTCAIALYDGMLERYPVQNLPHLGSAAYVEVRLAYFNPQIGAALVLSNPQLAQAASDDVFRRILLRRELDAVLDGLEQLAAGIDGSVLLVRWTSGTAVPSEAPRAEEAPRQEVRRRPSTAEPRPKMLAPPEPEPAVEPPRPPSRPSGEVWRRIGRGIKRAAAAVAGVVVAIVQGIRRLFLSIFDGARTLVQRMLPGQLQAQRRATRRPSRPPPPENSKALAGVALVILLVVALVTIWAWSSYSTSLHLNQAIRHAREYAEQAEAAVDDAVAETYWQSVLVELESIDESPEAEALRQQAQDALDELHGVIWVEPLLLHDFGYGLEPRRIVAHGQSLLVLDLAAKSVHRIQLNNAANAVEETLALFPGHDLGELVDMTWAGPGNGRSADVMLILEGIRTLIVYNPAWYDQEMWSDSAMEPNRLYLGSAPDQPAPVAVDSYEGNLYLLDPPTSQIWRYIPHGDGYPDAPEPYFPTLSPDPLGTARDMAIDGNIYVLFTDGTIKKYFNGGAVPFEVADVPEPAASFQALALNEDQLDGPLLLADGADERIVIVSADGTFQSQLRSRDDAFRSLQSLTFDEDTKRLFVLADNRLYVTPLDSVLP